MSATCSTCGAPIVWAKTLEKGKPAPFDAAPVPEGGFTLEAGVAIPVGLLTAENEPRYVSHFATCPDADKHRRLTERQELALGYIKEHGPVSSDELGAILHQHRLFGGGRGHHRDERCDYCGDEGSQMGKRLRELGLVTKSAGLDGGWILAAKDEPKHEERETSQLSETDPFPEGY